jgi:hypothetical protein
VNVHGVELYGTTVSDVENPATNCSDIRPKEKTGSLARNQYRDGLIWCTRVPSLGRLSNNQDVSFTTIRAWKGLGEVRPVVACQRCDK